MHRTSGDGTRLVAMAADKLSVEDPYGLLDRLARGLEALFYGERYKGLVLFGSYARGEAVQGSDVDLLLLLDGVVARVPQG
jgi:predicted nucleotidyltransferase